MSARQTADVSAVLHRRLASMPPMAAHGDGVYLVDREGKRYLDASGGAAVSCLGHSHPRVIEAVRQQVERLAYAHSAFFTNQPAEDLAQILVERAPEGFGAGRVAFLGSGSEAMEAALKLVRQHFVEKGEPERRRLIARRLSYHGNTLGALAVSGHPARRAIYEPLLMEVSHVSPCFAYRFKGAEETEDAYAARLAQELEAEILRLGPESVAAFVAETIVGATAGCVCPVPGYFRLVREVCDRYGVLLVADEVMCGMGRAGSWFAIGEEGVSPDVITVAKGLSAGYQPLGALLASESTLAPIVAGTGLLANGHTYMSHAVACAAGKAAVQAIEDEDLLDNVRTMGQSLRQALDATFGNHRYVGDIRGRGLFWAIELVADRSSKRPFDSELGLAAKVKSAAQDIGLICYPASGTADRGLGDHVVLAPPYIIDDRHIGEIVEKLDRAFSACLGQARAA
jgi:adenosylmethionine-8-amino-7-oxononanoate aminotransferase